MITKQRWRNRRHLRVEKTSLPHKGNKLLLEKVVISGEGGTFTTHRTIKLTISANKVMKHKRWGNKLFAEWVEKYQKFPPKNSPYYYLPHVASKPLSRSWTKLSNSEICWNIPFWIRTNENHRNCNATKNNFWRPEDKNKRIQKHNTL